MGRIARVVAPGMPHHIIQRGNRRMQTFFCDDDFKVYLALVGEWCRRHKVDIWAYCLMPNHVHLIAVPETLDGLARAIGEAHRRYTLHINAREGWRGYLWQGRFASFVMDEDYLLTAMRYVELNPVRARLAGKPAHWAWSSAKAHLTGQDDCLVKVQPMLEYVGDWERYLALDVEEEELIRLRQHTRTGRPLGNEAFLAQLEERLGRFLRKRKTGPKGPRKKTF